jgi:L-asparagine oxygenase
VENPDFLNSSAVLAHEIPSRVRAFLNCFKQLEPPSGVCLVTGYPISDTAIGRTPVHWRHRPEVSAVLEMELLFVLLASLLGDVIGWATQQEGYLIHDVMPMREDEYAQIGTGSQQLIWWHNEDAFHRTAETMWD